MPTISRERWSISTKRRANWELRLSLQDPLLLLTPQATSDSTGGRRDNAAGRRDPCGASGFGRRRRRTSRFFIGTGQRLEASPGDGGGGAGLRFPPGGSVSPHADRGRGGTTPRAAVVGSAFFVRAAAHRKRRNEGRTPTVIRRRRPMRGGLKSSQNVGRKRVASTRRTLSQTSYRPWSRTGCLLLAGKINVSYFALLLS